jgi:hypothetical protein
MRSIRTAIPGIPLLICQINWWLPISSLTPESCMAFHTRYWSQSVRNSSNIYNYYNYHEWNRKSRFNAAQLHSTVPNTSGCTRFSVDFRAVHLDDVATLRGARNVDSRCTGTTMGDYPRCSDLAHLPAAAMAPYDSGPPQAALS